MGDDQKEDKNKIGHADNIDNSEALMNQLLCKPIPENPIHPHLGGLLSLHTLNSVGCGPNPFCVAGFILVFI